MTALQIIACCATAVLKIGVFDTGMGEIANVSQAVSDMGASSWLQVVNVNSGDVAKSVDAAHNAGVVAFIGPKSAPLATVAGYICTKRQTPLLTSARPVLDVPSRFSYITNVLPDIGYIADAILDFSRQHSQFRISVLYDEDIYSKQLALELNKARGAHQVWIRNLPNGAQDISDYFVQLKIFFGKLVVIIGPSTNLLSAAKAAGLISVGRAWLIVGDDKNLPAMAPNEYFAYRGLLHLRISNQAGSPEYVQAKTLVEALSPAFPDLLPSDSVWSVGEAVLGLITASIPLPITLEMANFDSTKWAIASHYEIDASATHHQEVIWPGNEKVSSNMPLVGRTLKVHFIVGKPFMELSDDGVPDGFIWILQEKIRASLGYNITPSFRIGGWGDALKEIDNYDMVCGDITITREREKGADFTQPFVETSDSMIMLRPKLTTSIWQVFAPFRVTVWFTWVAVMFLAAFVFMVVEFDSHNSYLYEGFLQTPLETSIWWSYTAMLSCNDGNPKTRAGRLLNASVFFMSLVFVATYTAELAAMLSIQVASYEVDSFDDIQRGRVSLADVAVPNGTSNLGRLHTAMNNKTSFYVADDPESMVEAVKMGKAKVGIYDGIWNEWKASTDEDCALEVHGPPFNHFGLGFALPRESVYTTFVSEHILKLREEGEVDALIENRLRGKCVGDTKEEGINQLDHDAFWGVWLVFLISLVVVLICHTVEQHLVKKKKCVNFDVGLRAKNCLREKFDDHEAAVEEEMKKVRKEHEMETEEEKAEARAEFVKENFSKLLGKQTNDVGSAVANDVPSHSPINEPEPTKVQSCTSPKSDSVLSFDEKVPLPGRVS